MKSWFEKRGYPQNIISAEIGKVKLRKKSKENRNKLAKGVSFVVIYHPMLKSLGKILHDNIYLLYMNEEATRTFTPGPMTSFRIPHKTSSYLVRVKLYPLKRILGSRK